MRTRLGALTLAVFFLASEAAAVPFDGSFTADRDCPALVSKNKQTNPGNARIQAGAAYRVIEANQPDTPDWYRLRLPAAVPPERWVSASCGHLDTGMPGTLDEDGNACAIAGEADAYVLALSWQPAVCALNPGKPECRKMAPDAYAARNFTLHGLWPNRSGCGRDYGFCGQFHSPSRDFCDYPPIPLTAASKANLSQVMPGVESCLERHEWHKHGACQSVWTGETYFALAADLTRQFNASGIVDFVAPRIGKTVRTDDFLAGLDGVLGVGARKRIRLECERGMLVEVQVNLPPTLAPGAKLGPLLPLAGQTGGSTCGANFWLTP